MARKPHSRAGAGSRARAQHRPRVHRCDPLKFHRIGQSEIYACGCGSRWRFVPGDRPFTGEWSQSPEG